MNDLIVVGDVGHISEHHIPLHQRCNLDIGSALPTSLTDGTSTGHPDHHAVLKTWYDANNVDPLATFDPSDDRADEIHRLIHQSLATFYNTLTQVVAPSKPQNLSVDAPLSSRVDLNWSASSGATLYRIQRRLSGGTFADLDTTTAISYSDPTVAASTAYDYRVRAENSAGNSAYSVTVSVTTPPADIGTAPATPTGLSVLAVSATEIDISWNASTNATGYSLQRQKSGGAFSTIASPASTSYVDSGLTASTTYGYKIAASNSVGTSAYSTVQSATTPASPGNAPAPNWPTTFDRILTTSDDIKTIIQNGGTNKKYKLQAGTYHYSSITVPAGVEIYGSTVTVSPPSGSDRSGTNHTDETDFSRGVRIRCGTVIDGSGASANVFELPDSGTQRIEGLQIQNVKGPSSNVQPMYGRGISGNKSGTVTVRFCYFTTCATSGVGGVGGTLLIEYCELDKCGSSTLVGTNSGGVKSTGRQTAHFVYSHDNWGNGIWTDCDSPRMETTNCTCMRNTRDGIRFEKGEVGIFSFNKCQGNTSDGASGHGGIYARLSQDFIITHNIFGNNQKGGYGWTCTGSGGCGWKTPTCRNVTIGFNTMNGDSRNVGGASNLDDTNAP